MKKASAFLVIAEALSGLLSAVALIGNLVLEAKEAKQIGCDENASEKN